MKPCALCRQPALVFCESDRASLCWDCDAQVHGANFLVARHTRCLLCRRCQEPTPWKASGSRLGRTVSVCTACANGNCDVAAKEKPAAVAAASGRVAESGGMSTTAPSPEVREETWSDDGDGDDDTGTDYDDDDTGTDYDDDDEISSDEDGHNTMLDSEPDDDEDGDNQVVPWSTATEEATESTLPPPPTASSSSSDDADCYSYDYDSSPSRRDGPTRNRIMTTTMMHTDDNHFDAGLAKRRMLARGNAANLAPSYPYQDALDGCPTHRPGYLALPLYYSAAGAGDNTSSSSIAARAAGKPAPPAGDRPAEFAEIPPRQTSTTPPIPKAAHP